MAPEAHAMVIGQFDDHEREQISLAAARCSATVTFHSAIARALARLRGGHERPMCVLVAGDLNAQQLVDAVRDDAEWFGLPVLVLLSHASNQGYRAAYLAGADDVLVLADAGGLTRRLANLSRQRPDVRPAATLGRAMIASTDETSRRRLGRTLRQVGFDVVYAARLDEVNALAGTADAPVFVVTTEKLPAELSAVVHGKARGVTHIGAIPVMFVAPEEIAAPTRSGEHAVDMTSRLLFFADEQAKAPFRDRRSSTRKLCASVCSFREGGALDAIYGVTHNISRDGMYVRTIDPPRANSVVWLELNVPGTDTPVHLRARVMWQRLSGSGSGVLPPGFGLKIEADDCPPQDLQAFVAGYDALPE